MKNSSIEWTHHTFNPWIGCIQVSPACDHCYAMVMMDHRYHRVKWGAGEIRIRTTVQKLARQNRGQYAAETTRKAKKVASQPKK